MIHLKEGWIAKDADDSWWWYPREPKAQDTCWGGSEEENISKVAKGFPKCDWKDSLRKINPKGEIEETFEFDEVIEVSDGERWFRRHFKEKDGDKVVCYADGTSSKTHDKSTWWSKGRKL